MAERESYQEYDENLLINEEQLRALVSVASEGTPNEPQQQERSDAIVIDMNQESAASLDQSTTGISLARMPSLTVCPLCQKSFREPLEAHTVQLKQLKPRFFRRIKKFFPSAQLNVHSRVCIMDVHSMLQQRIEDLLQEDQLQYAKLQEDATKNLEKYELEEQNWLTQFEKRRTFGEKAADNVARVGGSWKFVLSLTGFLVSWASLNLILEKAVKEDKSWDPYPFILLNLFLSTLAAFQAPIIMMSQNRQDQKDRAISNYISRIILRAENQTRHMNAKMDHLLTHQWRRLLEIQEIQIDLLQILRYNQGESNTYKALQAKRPTVLAHQYWTQQTLPDPHTLMLLRSAYAIPDEDSEMIFEHWHNDGDNFFGNAQNVHLDLSVTHKIKSIDYELVLTDPKASLDDVFSGEGTISLRNDFDLACMDMQELQVQFSDKLVRFVNGELPSRYKPAFTALRIDKITDLWRAHIKGLHIRYTPMNQLAVAHVRANHRLSKVSVQFQMNPRQKKASVYATKLGGDDLSEVFQSIARGTFAQTWELVCVYEASGQVDEAAIDRSGSRFSVTETKDQFYSLTEHVAQLDREFIGEGRYVFYCGDCKAVFQGVIEPN